MAPARVSSNSNGRVAHVTMTTFAFTASPRVKKPERTAMDPARKRALFEQTALPHLNAAYNLARWLTRNNGDHAEDLVRGLSSRIPIL